MTREETKLIFKRIKANYHNFSDNKDKFEEWEKVFKDYFYVGVNKNLDDWLNDGNTEPPMAVQLINEFIRIEQREPRLFCKYCRRAFNLSNHLEHENHVARHNSIIYIKKREHLINKNFSEQALMEMEDSKFKDFYERFQDAIVNLLPSEIDKKRLLNCILTRNGGEIQVIPEVYRTIEKKLKKI